MKFFPTIKLKNIKTSAKEKALIPLCKAMG